MIYKELAIGDVFILPPDIVTLYKKTEMVGSCNCSKHNAKNLLSGVMVLMKDDTTVEKKEQ